MAESEWTVTESGDLTRAFAETARLLVVRQSFHEALTAIVQRTIEHVPGCEFGGVTMISRAGQVETTANTHAIVARTNALQAELGEGPCYDAIWDANTLRVDDMAVETRWSQYAPQAARLGLSSALGFQLYTHKGSFGTLDLYAAAPHAFDHSSENIGTVFAAYAAVALAWSHSENNLHQAIQARQTVGEAVGVLMERNRLTAEQAFDTLRRASNETNIKLRDVAERVTETGEEPR